MKSQLSKEDILQMSSERFPDSFVLTQARELRGEPPVELLSRYIAAVVFDLYGEGSDDAANLKRIAHELEVGSATLERVAGRLREG